MLLRQVQGARLYVVSADVPRKTKKKLGRPPLPEGVGKEFMLRVRMPIAMKDALTKAASAENITDSEFVRKLLLERLGP